MPYVHLVALLAIAQFIAFCVLVARARGRYGIAAPATSGHALFERAYRVQMNTLEQLAAFLPSLLIAAAYWSPSWVAGIGMVYLLGRGLYAVAYVRDPARRTLGFALTVLPTLALLLLGVAGALRTIAA